MPREPIYPRRHVLYAHIAIDLAEALLVRARADQTPQRVVVETALRAYLGKAARQDGQPETSTNTSGDRQ